MQASPVIKRGMGAVAPQKYTEPLSVLIRPYKDEDFPRVCEIFSDGIMGLVRPLFYTTVRRSSNQLIMLTFLAIIYIHTSSLLAVTGGTMLVVLVIWILIKAFVMAKLNSQMANIRAHYMERPSCYYLVAETYCKKTTGRGGGEVVGTLSLVPNGKDPSMCEMYHMVVDNRYRRRGVASLLIDAMLQRAREHGYRVCQLQTTMARHSAIALYKKKGFTIINERESPDANIFVRFLIRVILYKMEYVL